MKSSMDLVSVVNRPQINKKHFKDLKIGIKQEMNSNSCIPSVEMNTIAHKRVRPSFPLPPIDELHLMQFELHLFHCSIKKTPSALKKCSLSVPLTLEMNSINSIVP